VPPNIRALDVITVLAENHMNRTAFTDMSQATILPPVPYAAQSPGFRLAIFWMVPHDIDVTPMIELWGAKPKVLVIEEILAGYSELIKLKDMYHRDSIESPLQPIARGVPALSWYAPIPGRGGRGFTTPQGRGQFQGGRLATASTESMMTMPTGGSSQLATPTTPESWSTIARRTDMDPEAFLQHLVTKHVETALTAATERLDQRMKVALTPVKEQLGLLKEGQLKADRDRAEAAADRESADFDRQASNYTLRFSMWRNAKAMMKTKTEKDEVAHEKNELTAMRQRLLRLPGAKADMLMDFPPGQA
jgi:hypothetical protein